MNYKNLVDPQTGFMRGRDSHGNWRTPFAPVAYQGPGSVNGWGDITEGFTMISKATSLWPEGKGLRNAWTVSSS